MKPEMTDAADKVVDLLCRGTDKDIDLVYEALQVHLDIVQRTLTSLIAQHRGQPYTSAQRRDMREARRGKK